MPNPHGGKRNPGPGKKLGRPPKPDAKKRITFRLSQEIIRQLEGEKNKSGLVETLLIAYFKEHKQ